MYSFLHLSTVNFCNLFSNCIRLSQYFRIFKQNKVKRTMHWIAPSSSHHNVREAHQCTADDPGFWWLLSFRQEEQELICSAIKNWGEFLHATSCKPCPRALPSPVSRRFPACAYRSQHPSPALILLSSVLHSLCQEESKVHVYTHFPKLGMLSATPVSLLKELFSESYMWM